VDGIAGPGHHADMRRTVCACGLVALLLSAPSLSRAAPKPPPTPADFIDYPTCMLYAVGADTRIRVRARRASTVCATLSRQLSRSGGRWSLAAQRIRHILSPVCAFADPRGVVELQVIDASANSSRGRRICASLARAGWFDLGPP
jgi:hypothetical protein